MPASSSAPTDSPATMPYTTRPIAGGMRAPNAPAAATIAAAWAVS